MAFEAFNAPLVERKPGSQRPTGPSFTSLVEGLIEDFRNLIVQEIRLAKHEFEQEVGKARAAAVSMSVGIGLAILGGLLLIVMLVHLLQALTGLPLWACYGTIGGSCIAASIVLLMKAKRTATGIHMVPTKTVQTLKENVTWMKDQTQSRKM